jgi:hypothetical protein
LNLLIRKEPNQGFIGQVSNLNAVSPRIPKVATEAWVQLEFVLVPEFAPDFIDLLGIPHHQTEVLDPVWLQPLHLEDGHELMFTQLAPGRPFAASQHFESEDVGIELNRLFCIGHFDHNMVAAVNLYRHESLSGQLILSVPRTDAVDRAEKDVDRLRP